MSADRGGARLEPLRDMIRRYYGAECLIQTVRRSTGSHAFLFVVEAMYRGRQLRTLGTVGRLNEVMEHSAMDVLAPERLVFPYERLMLMSLALARAPAKALLLGLGGGAMCRHLAAYLPELDVTVVERDRGVIALAREHFHIERPVTRADATMVVADAAGSFDVVMVDLYDASGIAPARGPVLAGLRRGAAPRRLPRDQLGGRLDRRRDGHGLAEGGARRAAPRSLVLRGGARPARQHRAARTGRSGVPALHARDALGRVRHPQRTPARGPGHPTALRGEDALSRA